MECCKTCKNWLPDFTDLEFGDCFSGHERTIWDYRCGYDYVPDDCMQEWSGIKKANSESVYGNPIEINPDPGEIPDEGVFLSTGEPFYFHIETIHVTTSICLVFF